MNTLKLTLPLLEKLIVKKVLLSLLIALSCFSSVNAQLQKGDRTLAWQVDLAEDLDYNSSFNYAQEACMETVHLFYTWNSLEPDANNFNSSFINQTLDAANAYYPPNNTSVELQIAVINTVAKETPNDLNAVSFDSQVMIDRFKVLLDTVFNRLPQVKLEALNIGNESDNYFGTNPVAYQEFKVFLDSVTPYAKTKYFNLHGEDLKVGTTLTLHGLTDPAKATLCKTLNTGRDIISTTYYPLNSDFTMQDPSVVIDDFQDLITEYPDINTPIYFAECGYSSSTYCNSSETQQADFYTEVFEAWDMFNDNIKWITIFKTNDWSQAEVDDLGNYYGLSDTTFLEYLRTLGVRTWPGSGDNKVAYEQILCELDARGWCGTTCSLNINEESKEESEVVIYPNPTTGIVNLKSDFSIYRIKVYDNQGRIILEPKETVFDISSFINGSYTILTISKSGDTNYYKLIKK